MEINAEQRVNALLNELENSALTHAEIEKIERKIEVIRRNDN